MFDQYATYCPEDDKLRLYVGRVPREEYLALKADGWKSTPKQDCDFVAVWTVSREDTALEYSPGGIEDEDQSPQDRAADRAERFSGYRDKRESEAYGHADSYDAGPTVHGHQSQALAERRAAQHGRLAVRAVDQWRKAEYWTYRTEGVIKHALYVSAPGVRMGRIKKLEAELRKAEKDKAEYKFKFDSWSEILISEDEKAALLMANRFWDSGHYKHPRPESVSEYVREHGTSLYSLLTNADPITAKEAAAMWLEGSPEPEDENSWNNRYIEHLKLRLAYETQMLEAQGGRAADLEMVPGGRLGQKMITKVNKSPATGRVTSVEIWGERPSWQRRGSEAVIGPMLIKTERLAKEVYTPPTDQDLKEFKAWKAEQKAKTQAANKGAPKLINPSLEDAQRLQKIWNDKARERFERLKKEHKRFGEFCPSEVLEITQAVYSANSKGSYCKLETRELCAHGILKPQNYGGWSNARAEYLEKIGDAICKIRTAYKTIENPNAKTDTPDRIIVITDKPQKNLPACMFEPAAEEAATCAA